MPLKITFKIPLQIPLMITLIIPSMIPAKIPLKITLMMLLVVIPESHYLEKMRLVRPTEGPQSRIEAGVYGRCEAGRTLTI